MLLALLVLMSMGCAERHPYAEMCEAANKLATGAAAIELAAGATRDSADLDELRKLAAEMVRRADASLGSIDEEVRTGLTWTSLSNATEELRTGLGALDDGDLQGAANSAQRTLEQMRPAEAYLPATCFVAATIHT